MDTVSDSQLLTFECTNEVYNTIQKALELYQQLNDPNKKVLVLDNNLYTLVVKAYDYKMKTNIANREIYRKKQLKANPNYSFYDRKGGVKATEFPAALPAPLSI